MALHRDIFWIGRQWAVTGHGMQLIDQRLEGAFDIEVAQLWDDYFIESLRAKAWLKAEDFDKALAVARTRHSQAPSTSLAAPPVPAIEPIEPIAPPPPPKLERPATVELPQPLPAPPQAASPQPQPIAPPKQRSPDLQMKIDGGARFARPWRVWMKKT
jgi:outer membrane biosynthesis protein TonB